MVKEFAWTALNCCNNLTGEYKKLVWDLNQLKLKLVVWSCNYFLEKSGAAMAKVIEKFLLASMLMWIIPVAVLYGFNHNVFPGSSNLSPHSLTLWSGLLAVISVNAVIGFYIYLAMKEPSDKHEPDPAFLAQARASVQKPIESTEGPSQPREKDE